MTSSRRDIDTVVVLRGGLALFCVAAVGNALGLWDVQGWIEHLPTLCVFHRLTGLECPGCGMGRSLVLLTHGHLAASVRQHPFGLPLLLWAAFRSLLPERMLVRIQEHRLVRSDAVAVAVVGLLLTWWLVTKVV